MVRSRERHLLVAIDDLGGDAAAAAPGSSKPPALTLSDVHASIRDSVHRHVSGVSGSISDGDAAAASLQTKHYAPQARLVMVRVPHNQSTRVREAIGLVKLSKQRSVRLQVVRAFGNATLARRYLAQRIEMELRKCNDECTDRRLRDTLVGLAELQKR